MKRLSVGLAAVTVLGGTGLISCCHADQIFTYDASLGTLPDAQGWTYYQRTPASPAYTIQGDALHQGPTATGGYQWWESSDVSLDFDVGAVMEAELRIISSSSATAQPEGSPRAGYSLWIIDDYNRGFSVNIASGAIFLRGSGTWTAWKAFDSTDDFHS